MSVARTQLALAAISLALVVVAGCGKTTPATPGFPPGAVPPSSKFEVLPRCPSPRLPAEREGDDDGRIVVTNQTRQRIEGWGASVVTDTRVDPLVAPEGLTRRQLAELDRRVFEEAGINLIRVFGPGYGYYEALAARPGRADDPRLRFMRRVAPYGVRFMFTGAEAPASYKTGKTLAAGREDDYARYVAGYLRFARDAIGVPFEFAAIANEPDNRASRLVLTPPQTARVYGTLRREIARQELGTRLILGDTTGWGTACPYAQWLLRDGRLASSATAFASHPYYGNSEEARSVAELAATAGVSVWQTEFGSGCAMCPDDNSMHGAIVWARKIVSSLTKAQSSAWFAFRPVADATHGPGDALIVRDRRNGHRPYYASKRFDVFRQYSSAAPPGALRLLVRDSLRGTLAVAFRSRGRLSLVVTNVSARPRSAMIDLGPRRGTVATRRTSPRQSFAQERPIRYRGRPARLVLPPESVSTYSLVP